jgi:hypothetical protein
LLDGLNDPGGHFRGGVPVVGAVHLDRVQQGIMGDRQRDPPAGQLVLVVVVDGGQTGGVQLAQGGRDGGRTDRAAASGGESGGELVDGLRPAVAEEQQDAAGPSVAAGPSGRPAWPGRGDRSGSGCGVTAPSGCLAARPPRHRDR